MKTLRVQISEILGSQENIDLLEKIEGAPSEIYDTACMKIIDFLWEKNYWRVVLFNSIYIIYPIILALITVTTTADLFENRIAGCIIAAALMAIEILQIQIAGVSDYFTTMQNVFDFCGISCTILFFSLGSVASYDVSLYLLLVGLVGSFYKGIMSMSVISVKFRVLIKLLQSSFIDMIPFTVILMAQILMFASLQCVYKLSERNQGSKLYNGDSAFLNSFLEHYMIMFGQNPPLSDLDSIRWVLLIAFTFLLNVLNLNLLISIIGDTFAKVQSTQMAMNYRMKAQTLLEIAAMQKWERKHDGRLKYFHWFLYKDQESRENED